MPDTIAALSQLPEVLQTLQTPDGLQLRIRLDSDLRWFVGHFPGEPVLPAVVQVHWAIHYAAALGIDPMHFSGMPRLKFKQVMRPCECIELILRKAGPTLRFRYLRDGNVCSEGSIQFTDDRGTP